MEAKKSPKTNLESKRPIFLQIGFCVSLGLMILVFGFGQGTKIIPNLSPQQEYITVEQIEITRQDPLQPQVPTPAQALITDADIFKIVPDDTKIEVNPVFVDFDPWTDFNSNPTSSVEISGDPEIDELFLSAECISRC